MAVVEMTEEELKIFIRICNELNQNSSYQCKPIIEAYETFETDSVWGYNASEKDNLLKRRK